jgi:hypothetical protein
MNKKSEALLSTYLKEKVTVIHSAFEDSPRTVAFVEVDKSLSVADKLEKAFMLTNSIDGAWWDNKEVTAMFFPDKSCRSTSVGDMALVGNMKYKCESTGWMEQCND